LFALSVANFVGCSHKVTVRTLEANKEIEEMIRKKLEEGEEDEGEEEDDEDVIDVD
jgi:hypothetical protein